MHNHLSCVPNPIKAAYQLLCFWKHYGFDSRNVSIIAVSSQMAEFAAKWQKLGFHKPGLIEHIPNGVDLNRITGKRTSKMNAQKFSFLTFGGRNIQKRIDIVLKAGELLAQKRDDFECWITLGTDTQAVVDHYFKEQIPSWLVLKEQTTDIAALFNQVDCFVSSSEHETFSYAICEASVFGLPVIQSDIEGTMWNSQNPSTRLFHVNDAEDLCRQMDAIIDFDKTELEKQIKITIDNNSSKYSLESWAHKIVNFYNQIK